MTCLNGSHYECDKCHEKCEWYYEYLQLKKEGKLITQNRKVKPMKNESGKGEAEK